MENPDSLQKRRQEAGEGPDSLEKRRHEVGEGNAAGRRERETWMSMREGGKKP